MIGSGNVATHYARKLYQNGATIIQIIARSSESGTALANAVEASFTLDYNEIIKDADCYIISVQDDQLENVVDKLKTFLYPTNSLIVHTTGSASINVLKNMSTQYGVLYPLQSIKKENILLSDIPIFIDGNSEETKEKIKLLAHYISDKVAEANDEQRLKLHIAAVFVSNFPNYLYILADKLCKQNDLPFAYLLPLMEETVMRLHHFSPENMQTGPAIRADILTIKKHEALLEKENTEMLSVYQFLTEKIMEHFHS